MRLQSVEYLKVGQINKTLFTRSSDRFYIKESKRTHRFSVIYIYIYIYKKYAISMYVPFQTLTNAVRLKPNTEQMPCKCLF